MASECPQAELQAQSFANNTRTGLTGLRVRRPRGTDVVVVGDGALPGDPDLLGALARTNSVSSLELKGRLGNKHFEKHGHLLPSGQCWKTSEIASRKPLIR